MKRLALALATTALSAGCYYNPPQPGSVDIGWSFVRTKIVSGAPVQVTPAYNCLTRDVLGSYLVTDVVVYFDGDGGTVVPCSDAAGDGARFDAFGPGAHTAVVVARQTIGGNLVGTFSAQTSFTVTSGQVTTVTLPLGGVPGDLDVWGGLFNADGSTPFTCNPTVPSGTFTIADSVGTVIATGTASCATPPVGAASRLAVGFHAVDQLALDLDVYTIRMTAASGQYDSASPVNGCSGQAFNHVNPSDTGTASWFPNLFDVSAVPPASKCP